jgi:hypothetical protein
MSMPITAQAATTSNVTVTVVDGKNTKDTKDDTKYTVSVEKGAKMSDSDIGKVKVWTKENTQGRSAVTKEGYSVSVPGTIKNKFSKNTTLKLVYKQAKPIVEFYDPIGKKTYDIRVGEVGKTINFKSAPVHEGYQHIGWKGFAEKDILKKVTKYKATAVYKENKYKIEFDGNGASNPAAMKPVEVKYSQKYSLPKAKFTKAGYEFSAWEINGTKYKAGTKVSKLVSKDGGSVTAKAIWEAGTYTIKFNSNGGKGTMKSIQVKNGGECILPACKFTKDRYIFSEWVDDKGNTYGDEWDFSNETGKSTVTLKAKWEVNIYKEGKVTVKANGGKFSDGTTQKDLYTAFGEYVATDKLPIRKDYSFNGYKLQGDVMIDPLDAALFHLPRNASFVLLKPKKGDLGNGTATAQWIKQPTSEKFVAAIKKVVDTARTKKYAYGYSKDVVPTTDKKIACESMITKALYDLGFKTQPKGGFHFEEDRTEVVGDLPTFLEYCGFEKTKSGKRGSVVLVKGSNVKYMHAFVLNGTINESTMTADCFDCGSDVCIQQIQPLKNRKLKYQMKDLVFYSLPS